MKKTLTVSFLIAFFLMVITAVHSDSKETTTPKEVTPPKEATTPKEVSPGKIKLKSTRYTLKIEMTKGKFVVVKAKKSKTMDAGTYTPVDFSIGRKYKGKMWSMEAFTGSLGSLASFTVTSGKTTTIDVGPPLLVKIRCYTSIRNGIKSMEISYSLKGPGGEGYSVFPKINGEFYKRAPRIKIVTEKGKTVHMGNYGFG